MSIIKRILEERDRGVDVKSVYKVYLNSPRTPAVKDTPKPKPQPKPKQGRLFG